jgi:predicted ArsR family transcriptional regulator
MPAPSPPPSLQKQARALGDATRHAIFRRIADAADPVGVADLNAHFPLNHNAIRQHLAKLVDAGLVVESKAPAAGPGRPRLIYSVVPGVEGQWGTKGPYERLSRLLVEIIRTGLAPEEVGREAADQFRVPSPSGDPVADMNAAMARQGFDPETRRTRRGAEVVLHQCPFASAALTDRHTVCALHLGIAEGLADGSEVVVDELVAYDPRKAECRVRLLAEHTVEEAHVATLTLRGKTPRPPRRADARR